MRGLIVRPAELNDAAGINGVYNPFIRDSVVTFEIDEYSEEDRRAWLAAHLTDQRHPVYVAERKEGAEREGGALCGFASASAFDPRGAYGTSVKTSVFVDPACHGAGVAKRLYSALFEALAKTDIHRAYALIVAPNPASVALHKGFGFEQVATLNEVGRKFGRYCDVMWFEKRV